MTISAESRNHETVRLSFCSFLERKKSCIAGNLDPSDLSNSVKNGILYLEDPVDKVGILYLEDPVDKVGILYLEDPVDKVGILYLEDPVDKVGILYLEDPVDKVGFINLF